jgi:hypothetical protein
LLLSPLLLTLLLILVFGASAITGAPAIAYVPAIVDVPTVGVDVFVSIPAVTGTSAVGL